MQDPCNPHVTNTDVIPFVVQLSTNDGSKKLGITEIQRNSNTLEKNHLQIQEDEVMRVNVAKVSMGLGHLETLSPYESPLTLLIISPFVKVQE